MGPTGPAVSSWVERFKGAVTYAVVLTVLLFGAAAVTSGSQTDISRRIEVNTERAAEDAERAAVSAEIQARLTAANTCILQYFDAEAREKNTPECFADQGLPYPFDYDIAAELVGT